MDTRSRLIHGVSGVVTAASGAVTAAGGVVIAQAPSLGSPQGVAGIAVTICGMVAIVAPLFYKDRSEERAARVKDLSRELELARRQIADLQRQSAQVPAIQARVAVNEGRFEVHDEILQGKGWLSPARRVPGQRRPRETILIVEDDSDTAKALVKLFTAQGFAASFAATLDEAERMMELGPHWIILDLKIQGEDGLKLLRKIRDEGLTCHVAVVTATPDPARWAAAEALKPDALFRKPVVFDDLMARIAEVDDPGSPRQGQT